MAGGAVEPAPAVPRQARAAVREEGFLRWDSLGEFMALAESLDHLGRTYKNAKAQVLANTWTRPPPSSWTRTSRPPARSAARQSRQPLLPGMYWAQAVAAQTEDAALAKLANAAMEFGERETRILDELKLLPAGRGQGCRGHASQRHAEPDPGLHRLSLCPARRSALRADAPAQRERRSREAAVLSRFTARCLRSRCSCRRHACPGLSNIFTRTY